MIHNKFKLPIEERRALDILSRTPWQSFFTQGGKINSRFASQDRVSLGVYSIGGIVINCGYMIHIGATSIDISHEEEVFRIAVWEDTDFGRPEYEKRFRPPRQMLTEFPKDLEMRKFIGTLNSVEVLEGIEETINGAYKFDCGLVFKNPEGEKLLIVLDQEIPLDVKITTSLMNINLLQTI